MIVLTPNAALPALGALFDPDQPTLPRALSVLAGITRGEILADDPAHPSWAAVWEATYGTLYLGGRQTAPLVAELVTHFRQRGAVGLGCWPDGPLAGMLPPEPQYDGRTRYFPTRSPAVVLVPLCDAISPGYTLATRDEHLFAHSFDAADTLASFGSLAHALHHTRGVMVLHDGAVVCEAATGAAIRGRIEVGVTTHAQHRGRGLATAACAALIAACESEGLAPWWDCAAHNDASIRLAARLGFGAGREYRYLEWRQQ